ncbi:MAG: hypothetical protein M1832_002535 [Thelocarpon impressellum]|nr:MAG: hypothetical protein M1832_002535 [Thelocarpon impressellum]
MATKAHCVYCFDTLSASLEHRTPLTLAQTQELWDQYNGAEAGDEDEHELDVEGEVESGGRDGRPLSIARLRTGYDHLTVASPASGSSSGSSASTPSSSTPLSALGSSPNSSNSSRSSFFSIGRRARRRQRASDPERPLFVTWNTIGRSGGKTLRGCIGTFDPQELDDGLRSYALTSALSDSRFSPIVRRELPSLEVGVTLLTDFEPAATPMSWDLGVHGLRISFHHHSKRHGATYLPDVAVEQGWTKEETLVSLMRKAGWNGRKDEWSKVGDLRVVRYQGSKATMPYQEWLAWRQWVDRQGTS